MRGTIVTINETKQFGFIRSRETKKEVFFHFDLFKGRIPQEGSRVEFEAEESEKGLRATKITVLSLGANPHTTYSLPLLLVIAIFFIIARKTNPELPLFVSYLLAINISTLLITGFDKCIAGSERIRVPEAVLFFFALIGGSLGLLFGIKFFRHKTRKHSFLFYVTLLIALQIGVWFLLQNNL